MPLKRDSPCQIGGKKNDPFVLFRRFQYIWIRCQVQAGGTAAGVGTVAGIIWKPFGMACGK